MRQRAVRFTAQLYEKRTAPVVQCRPGAAVSPQCRPAALRVGSKFEHNTVQSSAPIQGCGVAAQGTTDTVFFIRERQISDQNVPI